MRFFIRMKTKQLFENKKKGFSLVEALAAVAILSIVGTSTLGLFQLTSKEALQARASRVLITARTIIDGSIRNPSAWKNTINNNTSLQCALTPPGCTISSSNNGFYDFVIYGSQNEKLTFESTDLQSRLSILGGTCPSGTADPSDLCPIKFVASWKPVCQNYPCINPVLEIKVNAILNFVSNPPIINPSRYSFSIYKGIDDGSLRSGCLMLNGNYNSLTGTCYPKTAGKTCASIGKPSQIVTAIDVNGNISCSPLYNGSCNALTQVMTGISDTGTAQCSPRSQPPNCPTPCIGAWGACSASCGGGTQIYGIITPATNGGPACVNPTPGATQSCNSNPCPINCVGSWGNCTQNCGGGIKTYTITTAAKFGGSSCPNNSGDSLTCNTQACPVPVDCGGSWSACDPQTGKKSFTVTQTAQNGGAGCPSSPQNCTVNCVGNWSTCSGSPAYKTFTWSVQPLNGGTNCNYTNGQTDTTGCAQPTNCVGTWSTCTKTCGTGQQTFTITTQAANGGTACATANGTSQNCNTQACQGQWTLVGSSSGHSCATWAIANYPSPHGYSNPTNPCTIGDQYYRLGACFGGPGGSSSAVNKGQRTIFQYSCQ